MVVVHLQKARETGGLPPPYEYLQFQKAENSRDLKHKPNVNQKGKSYGLPFWFVMIVADIIRPPLKHS